VGTVAGYGGPNAGCSGRCTFAGAWQRVCGKYSNITIALLWLAAVDIYRCNYTCRLWHYDCLTLYSLSGATKQAMFSLNVLGLSPACPYNSSVEMQHCCGIILNSGNPKYCEKNLYQCQFGHHKSQVEGPGIESGPPAVRGRKLNA
jgi:hypothetical protein